jgi:hypothetical protein
MVDLTFFHTFHKHPICPMRPCPHKKRVKIFAALAARRGKLAQPRMANKNICRRRGKTPSGSRGKLVKTWQLSWQGWAKWPRQQKLTNTICSRSFANSCSHASQKSIKNFSTFSINVPVPHIDRL